MRASRIVLHLGIALGLVWASPAFGQALIIDHNTDDIWQIPDAAIEQAKATLHIAYGHTSHGSQLISGMGTSGGQQLDQFMTNNGGTPDMYLWNSGGTGGALDLRDTPFVGASDLGNPDRYAWEQATRNYLTDHPDCNVIIWSWCGQANTTIENIDIYLDLMEGLIADYQDVHFVFMTGHLAGTGEFGQLNLANQHIRDHCIANERILYDFADIESYDPDELMHYMPMNANDNCDYDTGSGSANWALDWQATHIEGVDWWPSGAAHSQHLNGNLKGYAAWWLWAALAGWSECIEAPSNLTADVYPEVQEIVLNWTDNSSAPNEDSFIIQRRVDGGAWDNEYATVGPDVTQYIDDGLAIGTYDYRVVAHLNDDGSGNPCNSGPSNTVIAEMANAEPPAAPSDLVATPDSQARTIALEWVDNANNEDGFMLQRRVGAGTWDDNYATLPENATSYLDEGLAAETYTYRIVAHNEFGTSAASNEAEAMILDIPLAPSDLEAIGDSQTGEITLNWVDNSTSEDEFIIQRQVDGGAWNDAYDTVGPDVVTYLDDNLGAPPLPSGLYNYRIVAANTNGPSLPSNEASAVISTSVPNAPTDLVSEVNGFDIALTWVDQSSNEENFIVERAVDAADFEEYAVLPMDTEGFLDASLPALHNYAYRVKARNNFGDSGYSNEVSEYIAEESFTITLKQSVDGYTGCCDAYLDAANPTYNYGGDQYNSVRNDPKINMLVSFEMPEEIRDMIIVDAKIGFFCWTVSGWVDDSYLDLYRITEDWVEGNSDGSYEEGCASWLIRSGDAGGEIEWTTPGGTHDPEPLASSLIPSAAYYPEFDITQIVQEWATEFTPNQGLLLVNDSPVSTGIKASEYSEYGRPYMEITYTLPSSSAPELESHLDWKLLPAHPNPFNPSTALRFQVAQTQALQLCITSPDGRRVATLLNGIVDPGLHQVTWNGRDDHGRVVTSGVYFARLRSAQESQAIKILLAQ